MSFVVGLTGGIGSGKSAAAAEFERLGASVVDTDAKDGEAAGVNGTPAFYINGRMISGAQPFEVFKRLIDDELRAKGTEKR